MYVVNIAMLRGEDWTFENIVILFTKTMSKETKFSMLTSYFLPLSQHFLFENWFHPSTSYEHDFYTHKSNHGRK